MGADLIVRRLRCRLRGHDWNYHLSACSRCECTAEMIRRGYSRRQADQERAFLGSELGWRHTRAGILDSLAAGILSRDELRRARFVLSLPPAAHVKLVGL